MIVNLIVFPMILSFPLFIFAFMLYFVNVFIFRLSPPLDNWTFVIASVIGGVITFIAFITGVVLKEMTRELYPEKQTPEKKASDDTVSR